MSNRYSQTRNVLAIDPGPTESAFVIWNGINVLEIGKIDNSDMVHWLSDNPEAAVIEQVRSYGMAVGASVFDTVFWSGRFYERLTEAYGVPTDMMPRMDVKMHLCHSSRAKDANITQALIDRFAPNTRNKGKGIKSDPGFFYGFKSDIWAAFALAVTWWDKFSINREG